jgi:hypothetical protein
MMKMFKCFQISLFILILFENFNCVEENNKKYSEKIFLREKRNPVLTAFTGYKLLKEMFEEARNAYKCLNNKNGIQQGAQICFQKIKDSFSNDDNQSVEYFDKVFDKLDKISNQLSTELKCEFLEQEYNNIWQLISRILKKIKILINDLNDKIHKKYLQSLCRDHSEGIDKIYSLIENYLDEKKLIKIALNCYNYNFDALTEFHYKTLTMILQFMIVSSNCEQLFNYNKFDYNKFWHETENYLNYYKDYLFPLQFSQDSGYNGLKQVAKRILKENQKAQKTVEQLNKDYSFFDWSVLVYDKRFESNDYISYKQISNDPLCGSIIYDDAKLFGTDRDAKALVSYCYTKELENENIKIELYSDNPKSSTIETAKVNKNLNYVLTFKIPHCKYNYLAGFGGNLELEREKFSFGSVEWVNCDKNEIRFFDFYGSYKSESILNKIKNSFDSLLMPYIHREIIKIFAANIGTKSSMSKSKPKTTLQSFSLPEYEVESDLNFKQGKA